MKKSSILILVLLLVLIVTVPLVLLPDAEFGGADGQAEGIIAEIDPDYEPWFQPLVEPASGEIESMLFASQAALGAGVIAYYLGYRKGCKKNA
ncbi:energy-coupling factor ABC transporter substrate-binding protein [Alkalibacter rhizosphaerae]|nr:energy-coupling factor ABC transporter substrate-binding protein [Alkalibacter rhizosphaerae]